MEVALKYVPLGTDCPAMELKVTLPEKTQKKCVRKLVDVMEKAYRKKHGAFDEACCVSRNGVRLEGDLVVRDAVKAGDELVIRAAKVGRATAVAVREREESGQEKALAVTSVTQKDVVPASAGRHKRRRLVRMNVL